MTHNNTCKHCNGKISQRNPSGYCDHLYYPDNCDVCKNGHNDTGSEWETTWKKIRAEGVDEPMSEFYAKVETLLRTQLQKAREEGAAAERNSYCNDCLNCVPAAGQCDVHDELRTPTNDNEN